MNLLTTSARFPYVHKCQDSRSGVGINLQEPVGSALVSLRMIPGKKWRALFIICIILAVSVKILGDLTWRSRPIV
jgi:hypothetical protein